MPKALPELDLSSGICCTPLGRSVVNDADALEIALRLKALADPVRVKLLSLLLADEGDGLRTVDAGRRLGLSDATMSHHLGQLRRARLLVSDRRGTSVYYRVDRDALGALVRLLDPACC